MSRNRYILEINPDIAKSIVVFSMVGERGITAAFKIDDLEVLNSDYINEHYGDLQDTAYQRGLEDGKNIREKGCEGCKYAEMGSDTTICAQCCNAYHNQWTATDDKIEVGDEVKPFYTDITGVVTLIDGDTIYVLWRDGSSTSTLKLKEVVKTGRHFDIDKILKEMQS